jgi:hypothetical protein
MKRVIVTGLLALLGAGSMVVPAQADVYQCEQVQEVAPKPAEPLRYRTEIRPEVTEQSVVLEGRNCQRVGVNQVDTEDRYEGRRERRSMKRRYRYGTRNDPGRYYR